MANQKLSYQDIYKEIIKYYPVGVSPNDPVYREHPSTRSLLELCNEKMKMKEYFFFRELVEEFKGGDNKVLRSSVVSPPYAPCHSGSLLLAKQKIGNIIYTREVFFHVSILAPFYAIYGADKVVLMHDEDYLEFDPIIFISPAQVYEKWFPFLREKIETLFSNYQFLSYTHLRTRIKALSLAGARIKGLDASIFQAFFVPDDITVLQFKGDPTYE